MQKFVVVTGGVLSGLGKGVAAASIGKLLSSDYKIIPIKCDGYLNTDPGTMNPIEHGEVFVLDDGGEVDMDFGHYERFLDVTCKFDWNLTMGKVYMGVIDKEREGDYLGNTVQLIPHVTDYIKKRWKNIAREEDSDVTLIEIGGTVGDIENELYIEAARQLEQDLGRENVMYVHLTYVPIPETVNEQKTKPTQQSVQLLRERGVEPNMIIGRCEEWLTEKVKEKISLFCDVPTEAVITGKDVENIYRLPLMFEDEGVLEVIEEELDLEISENEREWKQLIENLENPKEEVNIAICGKYTDLGDSYASILEALTHCAAHFKTEVNVEMVETTGDPNFSELLEDTDGVIVPGGFGTRGIEGKIDAIKYCRKKGIPFLGICYGMQLAVVEYARNVCGLEDANTTEVDEDTSHPVIDIMPEQKEIEEMGGTMRLGSYPAILEKGSLAHELYGKTEVSERHRHRYEVNMEYVDQLKEEGMVFSGMSPDGRLPEFMELPDHPYFIGTQGHPELKSKLEDPAPLFHGLVEAALEND